MHLLFKHAYLRILIFEFSFFWIKFRLNLGYFSFKSCNIILNITDFSINLLDVLLNSLWKFLFCLFQIWWSFFFINFNLDFVDINVNLFDFIEKTIKFQIMSWLWLRRGSHDLACSWCSIADLSQHLILNLHSFFVLFT